MTDYGGYVDMSVYRYIDTSIYRYIDFNSILWFGANQGKGTSETRWRRARKDYLLDLYGLWRICRHVRISVY
jgi:hypothetical protein